MNLPANIVDYNFNTEVTLQNGEIYYLFANRLHNEKLDYWEGWKCAAGFNYLIIEPNLDVYGSMCKNDYLGNLETGFKLFDDYTTCKQPRCIGCTQDLMIEKFVEEK